MFRLRKTLCKGWLFGLVLCVGIGQLGSPAVAQPTQKERPKVYLFPFVKADDVSVVVFNSINKQFETLFEMSQKMELINEKGLQAEQVEKARDEKRKTTQLMPEWLEQADDLLWTGKDQIVKKDFEAAVKSLTKARKLYEEHYLELRDYDKLVDVTLQLAIAFFQAGYGDDGEEYLKDVLVWRPDLAVDPKKYPKELVDALARLRDMMSKRKGGVLRVEATPAEGSQVFVDGMLKGTLGAGQTGIDVEGLYRGKHYVQVVRDGFKIYAEKVGVPPEGRTAKVVANLESAPDEGAVAVGGDLNKLAFEVYQHSVTGDFTVEFARQASDFSNQSQVPYLLFGFVSKENTGFKLTLFLFKAEWSALAEVDPVVFDANLANLQVNLLFLEANLSEALTTFPKNKTVRGVPAVYVQAQKKPEPEPVKVAVNL